MLVQLAVRWALFVALAVAFVVQPQATEPLAAGAPTDGIGAILPHRARPEAVNRMLADRLDNLLPRLMRETGIDMWLVINREYNEDPVYLTLVPEPVFAARRTTMLVFFDRGDDEGVERITVSRYPLGEYYAATWDGGAPDEQWARLAEVIAERNPQRIGINTSTHWGQADGLSAALRDRLTTALKPELRERLVSAEELCIRWLETRTPDELEVYPHIVGLARSVIAEAFSSRAITPGVTTTDDVSWFIRQRFEELQLDQWFQPFVTIQRRGDDAGEDDVFLGRFEGVVRRGDALHTDVGICYLRLCTDTQEMAYVLRADEDQVPTGLVEGMRVGNRWQDLLTAAFVTGRTGDEILDVAQAATGAEGIRSSIYSHPIGFHGHAVGPTVGMWDNQGHTPIHGDWKLYPNTAWAIEGNVVVRVPEWDDQWVQIRLEQSAVYDGAHVHYLAGRQTAWHVVR